MSYKRKFSDKEIEEFVAGKINGKKVTDDELEEMAEEIFNSPDDSDYAIFLSDTMNIAAIQDDENPELSNELQELIKKYPPPPKVIKKISDYNDIKFGRIYSTITPVNWPWKSADTRLVMALSDISDTYFEERPDVKIVPISLKTDMATDEDVIIQDDNILNGTKFMIRFSNIDNIFCEQLFECFGEIPSKYYSNLKHAWKYALNLVDSAAENCGKPLVDENDCRLKFLNDEYEVLSYISDPINDFISNLELADHDNENDAEIECKILPLTYILENELLENKQYSLAAAKENVLLLSEGRWFTIYRSEKIKVTLRIYSNGLGLYVQSLQNSKNIHFKIIADSEKLLLEKELDMGNNSVVMLDPPANFVNRSLTLVLGSSVFKKEIKFKLYHGFFK